jgi:catechol 2,3-dioxygenase-like lactoylglutathione lyase family enzyme
MATQGINHVNLRAPRELLDQLKDFYCDVVGLEVGPRPPFPAFGYWLYAGGRAVVHLYQASAGEARQTGIETTLDHVAFDCVDAQAVEALLRQRGVPYQKTVVPASRQLQLFVVDPAGNKVELNFGETTAAAADVTQSYR